MKSLFGWATAAGAAILMTIALASAQERRESGQDQKGKQKTESQSRESTTQPGRDTAGRDRILGDGQLAMWITTDNEGEIELGKFVAARSQNDQVKKFAQRIVDDHTAIVNKVRRMAALASGAATERQPGRADDEKRTRPADPAKRPTTDTAQTRPGEETTIRRGYLDPEGRIDLLRLKQDIGRQHVETLKKELDEKSGAEFDKCYMGLQIVAHLQVADTVKVMKNYASPELKKTLEEGEKVIQEHLDQAKQIMKQLEQQGGTRSSSKEDK